MDVRQAKDFLVRQTLLQASLERVPMSGVERRMMYFTEGPDAVEDRVSLNQEFEKQCDMAQYEAKISRLLSQAYRRLRKENSPAIQEWQAAVETLQQGDHYLLVLLGRHAVSGIPLGSLLRVTVRLALLALATCGAWIGLRCFMQATGISAGWIFGPVFVGILLAVAINPNAVSKLTQRAVMWVIVFPIKRKDSAR